MVRSGRWKTLMIFELIWRWTDGVSGGSGYLHAGRVQHFDSRVRKRRVKSVLMEFTSVVAMVVTAVLVFEATERRRKK